MAKESAWILAVVYGLVSSTVTRAETQPRPLKERARIRAELNIKRVNALLLPAMRKAGIDCWIIMSREFHKDFVLQYIEDNMENTPGGHRNAYVFFDDGSDHLEKILIGTHLSRGAAISGMK